METGVTIYNDSETIIPTIIPAKQLSKMEVIKYYAELLENGNATIHEIGKQLSLTTKQIDFAKYYTEATEQFGNGVRAAGKAYNLNPDDKNQRNRCSVYSSNNLKHHGILTLIDILLSADGLNDSYVDKQLLFLISQHSDLKVKGLAIKEYNALKNRTKKMIEINNVRTYDFTNLSKEELAVLIALADRAKLGNG